MEVGNFDLYDLLIYGNTNSDIKLQSNDAIVINPTGKTIKISGEVKNQAIFELKGGEDFSDLLTFASGFTNLADLKRITISSLAENGERIYKNFKSSELKLIQLKDGDEIFVNRLSNTPRNIIKVIGEIASPGYMAFEEDITLDKLIARIIFGINLYTFCYY